MDGMDTQIATCPNCTRDAVNLSPRCGAESEKGELAVANELVINWQREVHDYVHVNIQKA